MVTLLYFQQADSIADINKICQVILHLPKPDGQLLEGLNQWISLGRSSESVFLVVCQSAEVCSNPLVQTMWNQVIQSLVDGDCCFDPTAIMLQLRLEGLEKLIDHSTVVKLEDAFVELFSKSSMSKQIKILRNRNNFSEVRNC